MPTTHNHERNAARGMTATEKHELIQAANREPELPDMADDGVHWQTRQELSGGYLTFQIRARLACGHWAAWVHEASSDWDFPDELKLCPAGCGEVHYHPVVVADLKAGRTMSDQPPPPRRPVCPYCGDPAGIGPDGRRRPHDCN